MGLTLFLRYRENDLLLGEEDEGVRKLVAEEPQSGEGQGRGGTYRNSTVLSRRGSSTTLPRTTANASGT